MDSEQIIRMAAQARERSRALQKAASDADATTVREYRTATYHRAHNLMTQSAEAWEWEAERLEGLLEAPKDYSEAV